MKVLIVEDRAADLNQAADVVRALGIEDVAARKNAVSARRYLETAIEKHDPLPQIMILDLDLGYDSGHELLRFWYKNPRLPNTRVVVWTALGTEQQAICKLFDVDAVVSKWEGLGALEAAIRPLSVKAG